MWGFVGSKILTGVFLVYWGCLQCLPGGTLNEHDRRVETQQFSASAVKAHRLCLLICIKSAAVVAASEAYYGIGTLRTPWTTAQVDVLPAL